MLITDQHILYLERVERGSVSFKDQIYIALDNLALDLHIAIQSELLGLTHIVSDGGSILVGLTRHGLAMLNDDRECWG